MIQKDNEVELYQEMKRIYVHSQGESDIQHYAKKPNHGFYYLDSHLKITAIYGYRYGLFLRCLIV